MRYEAFYIPAKDQEGSYRPKYTNFGIDDIAFLDTDNRPLFYVTTHEGFSMIHPDVLDVDISWIKSGYWYARFFIVASIFSIQVLFMEFSE